MAEDKYKTTSSGNEMSIGKIFFLLLLGVFILWVITGGSEKKTTDKSIFKKSPYPASSEIKSFGQIENN